MKMTIREHVVRTVNSASATASERKLERATFAITFVAVLQHSTETIIPGIEGKLRQYGCAWKC